MTKRAPVLWLRALSFGDCPRKKVLQCAGATALGTVHHTDKQAMGVARHGSEKECGDAARVVGSASLITLLVVAALPVVEIAGPVTVLLEEVCRPASTALVQ